MSLSPLPQIMIEPLVRGALLEDLGRAGDITTDAIVPAAQSAEMVLAARQPGVVAGLDLAILAFRLIDPAVEVTVAKPDGSKVAAGDVIASVKGPARALLTGERTALNFLCRLSGIATATAAVVAAVAGHKARIVCTRKTTPGLRAVEKYALRAGGGSNHRFGLDDGVLIKDNHLAAIGGADRVTRAVQAARRHAPHTTRIEVEVTTLAEVKEALKAGADIIMLDNMSVAEMADAVRVVAGGALLEASGGVRLETVRQIAETGVDLISVGALTHSAPALDISLNFTIR